MDTEEKSGFEASMNDWEGELSIKVIRKDGRVENLGVIPPDVHPLFASPPRSRWFIPIIAILGLIVVAGLIAFGFSIFAKLFSSLVIFALVTNAGVNYMAADFLSTSTNHIANFNQHDNGTGTNAAAVTDTALQTATGGSRVAGTQSNPSSNQYRSVATISFTSSFAITEWGIFSATSSGTLWDRRVFSAVNVVNGDSIQYTYTLTVNSGGS